MGTNTRTTLDGNNDRRSCAALTMAYIFALVFVISTVLSVMLINVELILLRPQIYKKALTDQEVYVALPDLIARQIVHSLRSNPCLADPSRCEWEGLPWTNTGLPSYLTAIDEEAWVQILSPLLSPAWLQRETENMIDQFFTKLQSGEEQIEMVISMDGLKNDFNQQTTSQIVSALLDNAPGCTEEELISIAALAFGQQAIELPICLPTEEWRPFLEDELQRSLGTMANGLQNEITLKLDLADGNPTFDENAPGNRPLRWLKTLRGFFLLSAVLPILALLMVTLFAVRSLYSLLRWWGIPFILSGGVLFVPAATFGLTYKWFLNTLLLPNIPTGFTPELMNMFFSFTQSVISRFSFWIGLEAGLLFLAGSAMLLLSLFIRPQKDLL